ncbi:hypothetical protein PQX77_015513 [Marasmius sp. AFHP31]|nr:hypothetical protein PQX77_015513 [Marasmius sp. AFHP31]
MTRTPLFDLPTSHTTLMGTYLFNTFTPVPFHAKIFIPRQTISNLGSFGIVKLDGTSSATHVLVMKPAARQTGGDAQISQPMMATVERSAVHGSPVLSSLDTCGTAMATPTTKYQSTSSVTSAPVLHILLRHIPHSITTPPHPTLLLYPHPASQINNVLLFLLFSLPAISTTAFHTGIVHASEQASLFPPITPSALGRDRKSRVYVEAVLREVQNPQSGSGFDLLDHISEPA